MGGGHVKLTLTKRGGGRKCFSHTERGGGCHKKFEVVFMW